jgi:hypothetical protein
MAVFTNYLDILPDPNNPIGDGGQAGGTAGPGYASVKLASESPVIRDKTNSGRHLARANASHNWNIDISYNPMTRLQFEPIYNFLLQKRGSLTPFYVSLPQYVAPQNSVFAAYVAGGVNLDCASTTVAGKTSMLVGKTGWVAANGTPKPGDLFTIAGTNSNHKKAYMVTRVETNSTYLSPGGPYSRPTTAQVIIHHTPGLQRAVATGDDVVFNNPLIKVVLGSDIQEYSLGTNNLYSFSLKLEEVQ